jgi:hypothetical protein
MDNNSLYTVEDYEQAQQFLLEKQAQKLQAQKQREEKIKAMIKTRREQLDEAIAIGERLKQEKTDQLTLEYHKQVFRNEKDQETARCRFYLAQDRLARFNTHTSKSPVRRRRSTQLQENKNYVEDVFQKAQLEIAIGNGKNFPSRGRYSIPRTIRE